MPVKFFPNKQIEALESLITKDGKPLYGEINVYRMLYNELKDSEDDFFIWHDLKFNTHSDSHNPYKKNESQIDFLLICKFGVCVIEVKGGQVEYHNSEFIFRHNGILQKPMDQNPYKQVEGYKYTLLQKILQKYDKKTFIEICIFPSTRIDYSKYKNLFADIIYTQIKSENGLSIKNFILNRFKSIKAKFESKQPYKLQEFSSLELFEVQKILSPTLTDLNLFVSSVETRNWLGLKNFEIFEGLNKNQRVLIQGIPGCGKTTYALAYADQRRHQKGLYLCWNKFLKIHIESKVKDRQLSNLEVNTYFKFLLELGINNISLDDTLEVFRSKVLEKLSKSIDRVYDYIIIDEGQDVVNRSVELLLDKLCGNGKGLTNGNLLFLCDIEQSYASNEENINEDIDLLSIYFTHFQMNNSQRSLTEPYIRDLAALALLNIYQIDKDETLDIFPKIISRYPSFKKARDKMVNDFLKPIRDPKNSTRGKDCVLLIESSLLVQENLDDLFMNECEEMTEKNVTDTSNILRYISPLKFKGLERENVALIIRQPKATNQHEIYVGITRSKSNLKIYIVYD